jgi:hypothetical protein
MSAAGASSGQSGPVCSGVLTSSTGFQEHSSESWPLSQRQLPVCRGRLPSGWGLSHHEHGVGIWMASFSHWAHSWLQWLVLWYQKQQSVSDPLLEWTDSFLTLKLSLYC